MTRIKITMIYSVFLLFAFAKANAQTSTELEKSNMNPEDVVNEFFEFFHQKDTTNLRILFQEKAMLHSLMIKGDKSVTANDSVDSFLKGIAQIPETITFNEEISNVTVSGDESIASVSMDYTFTVNNTKSHTGKNIFLMLKTREGWKITSIADSRVYD